MKFIYTTQYQQTTKNGKSPQNRTESTALVRRTIVTFDYLIFPNGAINRKENQTN